jgi:hypothetical protein
MTDINPTTYLNLFGHRRDVFAEQQDSGIYLPIESDLTEDEVSEHLAGFASYGVYTTSPVDNTVRFIMWDLDTHDQGALGTLSRLVSKLVMDTGYDDFTCLLKESSGNKGTHIWLFLDQPVSAAKVRRWVMRDFMPAWTEAAKENGWPVGIEVFPKQDEVREGSFGNLVKLPFGKHRVSGKFSELLHHHGWAEAIHDVRPFPVDLIPEVAPEEVGRRTRKLDSNVDTDGGPASPFPCVDQILYKGVGKGVRDNAMFHLALYLYGHAVPEDLAFDMCSRANEHFDPPLTEREVEAKVKGAYSGRYASARCGTDWLAEICPGPCRTGWGVQANTAENLLRKAEPGTGIEVEVLRRQQEGQRVRITVRHPDAANTPTFICNE